MEKKTIGEQLDALNETLREAERQFGVFEVKGEAKLDSVHTLMWCKRGNSWGLYVQVQPTIGGMLGGQEYADLALSTTTMQVRTLAAANLRALYADCVANEKRIKAEIAAAHKAAKDFVAELTAPEYALADDEHKRLFVLGKGCWYLAFSEDAPALRQTLEEMRARFRKAWGQTYADHTPEAYEYIDELARRVHAFCEHAGWKVRLLNDCGDDWFEASQHGYVEADTRYRG